MALRSALDRETGRAIVVAVLESISQVVAARLIAGLFQLDGRLALGAIIASEAEGER